MDIDQIIQSIKVDESNFQHIAETGRINGSFYLDMKIILMMERKFLREVVMRAHLALPENDENLEWFEEGVNIQKNPDFIERIFTTLNLAEL